MQTVFFSVVFPFFSTIPHVSCTFIGLKRRRRSKKKHTQFSLSHSSFCLRFSSSVLSSSRRSCVRVSFSSFRTLFTLICSVFISFMLAFIFRSAGFFVHHHFPFLYFLSLNSSIFFLLLFSFCSCKGLVPGALRESVFYYTYQIRSCQSAECAFLVWQTSMLCVTDGHILIYINFYSIRLNRTSASMRAQYLSSKPIERNTIFI